MGTITRSQYLDPNQLQRLSQTLHRPDLHPNLSIISSSPPVGTDVPPGYHLVYFTPSALEQDLGIDGTDRTFNPLSPFTRRMWAGGELTWVKDNPLRVGDEVQEATRLLSAEEKTTTDNEALIIVGVEKIFKNRKGIALIDKRFVLVFVPPLQLACFIWPPYPIPVLILHTRNWVFRREINPSKALTQQRMIADPITIPPKGAKSHTPFSYHLRHVSCSQLTRNVNTRGRNPHLQPNTHLTLPLLGPDIQCS
jgi:hypothetical protein